MYVGDICRRDVAIAGKNDSIVRAAQIMRENHVGDVIVVDVAKGLRSPIGILTDRDIVIGAVAKDERLQNLTIGDVMSKELLLASEEDELIFTLKRMRAKGVRRIPVTDSNENLVGILSIDDVLDSITNQLMDIEQLIAKEQSIERTLHS